jgi:hypothetical protein
MSNTKQNYSSQSVGAPSKQLLTDPASAYQEPQRVVEDNSLSRDQKIEILRRWEYDIRELQVADEEGMTAPKPHPVTLESIFASLRILGAPPDLEHAAPTKQGGH